MPSDGLALNQGLLVAFLAEPMAAVRRDARGGGDLDYDMSVVVHPSKTRLRQSGRSRATAQTDMPVGDSRRRSKLVERFAAALVLLVLGVTMFVARPAAAYPTTTSAGGSTFAYDAPPIARSDAEEFVVVDAFTHQARSVRDGFGWPRHWDGGAPTTSPHSFVATEAVYPDGRGVRALLRRDE